MTHIIFMTLSAAGIGMLAARAGDLFRTALSPKKGCDETHLKTSAWSYKADAAQPGRTWLRVQRHGTC